MAELTAIRRDLHEHPEIGFEEVRTAGIVAKALRSHDERMEAALDVLMEVSENRQVLFFTCQKREADYLRRAYPHRFSYTEL